MSTAHSTREGWLQAAVTEFRPDFAALGHELPPVHISVGFPGGGSRRTRIGECWMPSASSDGVGHIFVSPILSDGLRVLDVLAHELTHAVNHAEGHNGHGAEFSAIAKPLGLVGKMTATEAGPKLVERLKAMLAVLGDYPHPKLSPGGSPAKKQSTRMIKLECDDCGYVVRTTQKWIDVGLPSCPCGVTMVRSDA